MSDRNNGLILLFTKDEFLPGIISSILGREGIRLITADDERMLFSLTEEYRPVAIIIDSGISGIMGYRPWEIIRKLDRFRDIKIILIIAATPQCENGAYEYADDVIDRDLVNSHILSAIRKWVGMGHSGEDKQVHEDAMRLARAIVSDIVYYNSETALRGVVDGSFYDLMSKEIEEGRLLYQSRIPLDIRSVSDYYDAAIRGFILKIKQYNLVLP